MSGQQATETGANAVSYDVVTYQLQEGQLVETERVSYAEPADIEARHGAVADVLAERERQRDLFSERDDAENGWEDWDAIIDRYQQHALNVRGDTSQRRRALVKLAAVTVAAIEADDARVAALARG